MAGASDCEMRGVLTCASSLQGMEQPELPATGCRWECKTIEVRGWLSVVEGPPFGPSRCLRIHVLLLQVFPRARWLGKTSWTRSSECRHRLYVSGKHRSATTIILFSSLHFFFLAQQVT